MLTRSVKLIIVGALVGAALGGTAAWAASKIQDRHLSPELAGGRQLTLKTDAKDYIGLAMSLVVVIRNLVDLFRSA
jgi:ABC-type lipoprotein release transport system permease subunit